MINHRLRVTQPADRWITIAGGNENSRREEV